MVKCGETPSSFLEFWNVSLHKESRHRSPDFPRPTSLDLLDPPSQRPSRIKNQTSTNCAGRSDPGGYAGRAASLMNKPRMHPSPCTITGNRDLTLSPHSSLLSYIKPNHKNHMEPTVSPLLTVPRRSNVRRAPTMRRIIPWSHTRVENDSVIANPLGITDERGSGEVPEQPQEPVGHSFPIYDVGVLFAQHFPHAYHRL